MMPPAASIIVTTYNRPAAIARLCEAILALDYPLDQLELVIVDDGSETPVAPVVEPFRDHLRIVCHRQPNAGPAVGRNVAVSLAGAPFILMVDDDCVPQPSWAHRLIALLEQNPAAMAGGHTVNGLPENIFATVSQMVVDRVYAVHNEDHSRAGFFTSNNLAIGRGQFLSVGAFDDRYHLAGAEDRGFCDRWRNAGHTMLYDPEAVVLHFHHMTLRKFLRQHFNYGRGALHYHVTRATPNREEARTARSIVFDFKAWKEAIRQQAPRHSSLCLVLLLVAWQAANAAGYFWEAITRGTRVGATRND